MEEVNKEDEDIPFPENWKRYELDTFKKDICDWLDWNIEEEFTKDPEFYLSDSVNEKRLYFRVIERGSTNEDTDPTDLVDEGYLCVFVPFETKHVEDLDD